MTAQPRLTPQQCIEMAEAHRAADALRKGRFEWVGGAACSVGCFNHDLGQAPGDLSALSQSTGYPEWLHHFQEAVFQGLPDDQAKDWHVDLFRKAATITDWVEAYHQLMIGILTVALPRDSSGIVQPVIDLHKRGSSVTAEEWAAAGDAAGAARYAAGDAAWAAWAAAGDAAWDAAWAGIRAAFLNIKVTA